VILRQPATHSLDQLLRERLHRLRLSLGDSTGNIIDAHAAFLPIEVQRGDYLGIHGHGKGKRPNDTEMMGVSFGNIVSRGDERRRPGLQCRVVCNIESPVIVESLCLGAFEIPVRQREKVDDFLPRRPMRLEPSVFLPVA
jgi:hypothetical protein